MNVKKELKYTPSHEWLQIDGDKVRIGITDFAQNHMGSLVFVELPELGAEVGKGDPLAVVESVKAASDVYAPISGTVVEIKEELLDSPEKVNEAPYESWLAILQLSNPEELEGLLDADQYEALCQQEG